jgi:hypothetical protein
MRDHGSDGDQLFHRQAGYRSPSRTSGRPQDPAEERKGGLPVAFKSNSSVFLFDRGKIGGSGRECPNRF